MARTSHLKTLEKGPDVWNTWRRENPDIAPDLSGANLINADLGRANLDDTDLSKADLSKAQLSHANLNRSNLDLATLTLADLLGVVANNASFREASFFGAFMFGARLKGADLSGANLLGATLMGADLTGATLGHANLMGANFQDANLSATDLTGADLTAASLVGTDVSGAVFQECAVHGMAAWNLKGNAQIQSELTITPRGEQTILAGDLEAAQLCNLLLYGKKVPLLLEQACPRLVILFGRIRSDRKELYGRIQRVLDSQGFALLIVDIDRPSWSDVSRNIKILAQRSRLVLVDMSASRNTQEVAKASVIDLPTVPIQPIVDTTSKTAAIEFPRSHSVHPIQQFETLEDLEAKLISILPIAERMRGGQS